MCALLTWRPRGAGGGPPPARSACSCWRMRPRLRSRRPARWTWRNSWTAASPRSGTDMVMPARRPTVPTETLSTVPLKVVYRAADVDLAYRRDLGDPGEYPFTRGIHPDMYRGRLWTMRQFAGVGTAEDANQRFHYLLHGGRTGLSVAFDMPTLMGYDSDHPRALGEVGREGVAIDSLADLGAFLEGRPR